MWTSEREPIRGCLLTAGCKVTYSLTEHFIAMMKTGYGLMERTALVLAEFWFGTPHDGRFGRKEAQMEVLY